MNDRAKTEATADAVAVAASRGWDEWLRLFANRNEVAEEYAKMLRRWGLSADYRGVNEAILQRWSPAGLKYIKTRAWKIATGHL
jgi:hypothetical protein